VRSLVRPGDTLSLAFGDARPNATVREIVRAFRGTRPEFTVVASGLLSTQQALVGAGLVRRLVTSYAGENYPAPYPSPVIRRAVEDGSLEIDDWSLYSLVARLAAGALGVPFLPVRSFADGSMATDTAPARWAQVPDPFGGDPVTVVPSLVPDVCLIHGVAADEDGNVVLAGPVGEREWGALAARRGAIATVERIVSREELRAYNQQVRVPAAAVAAVCEAPRGSHPYGLYAGGFPDVVGYDEDAEFMLSVRAAMADADGFDAWIDRWLSEPWPTAPASRPSPPAPSLQQGEYTDSELMVVAAGRALRRRAEAAGAQLLLAGIGQANLAAWLAHSELPATSGVELAEMGMVGYQPQPGDPYLFANRNKPSAAQLTDTMAALGVYVGHPRMQTLAAVGAGQVDARGNINSTVGVDGRYLTGSGGANDIASVAAELLVVIKQSRGRLPDQVPFVTAPGRAVRTVVTDRAVFVRENEGFRLHRLLRPWGARDASGAELLDEVRDRCGWADVTWPDDLVEEEPPTEHELATVRAYDPYRYFLR
jgi:acyl CoA:acetate/3-ketoacid CoA transferase alpha subunit/acyl CoA:acetate/3-ketoacid CoA transferase beta subunit